MFNGSLNDVETIYKRAMVMINNLMTKYRLVKRIKLLDNDKHIFFQLAQGNRQIVQMINQGADIHLVVPQSKPYFEVALDSKILTFEPPQLKEQLLRKQLSELSDKQINYTSKMCRDHDFTNDFISSQEGEVYQKDDCAALLKEKFDTFKVPDQQQMVEILKKHLKRNQIESYNKQLIDARFYINQELEIIIEYKINDSQLSLHEKVKRRKWSDVWCSVGHQYTYQQIDELTQSLLEQMFIVDEIQLRQQRTVIYNIIQYCPQNYQGSKEVKLHTHKQGTWKILGFLPKSFNIHKRFNKQKLIIVQNQHQLFFLDHQDLITGDLVKLDSHLLEQYIQIIDQSQKRLESIKKQLQSANFAIDQLLLKEIHRIIALVQEQEVLEEIEAKIKDYEEQLQKLASELDKLENVEQFFTEAREQIQDQYDQIQFHMKTKQTIYNEYKKVYQNVMDRLLNFKGTDSLSANKIELKGLYNRILLERKRVEQQLPIYTKKSELLKAIQQQQVTLLIGETGSGKSTQLVQYISEEILQDGKVICVEPRMLAARQLARRVAEEMNTRVGDGVGYLTEFGEIEDNTKIVFTQDRILLNLLLNDSSLNQYEIIIIDEAHERTMNTDILLGLMKKLLIQRKDLKLIIMSATMDENLFGSYFNCDVYKVEGKLYPIKIKYQESFRDDYIEQIELLIYRKVIEKLNNRTYKQRHVLVFLAGVDEINRILWTFQTNYRHQNIMYLGLHGSMATDEQFEVFRETNKVKIIFATRVAETALTINDVSVVIDIGVDRFIYFDQMRSMQITKVGMISQAQANQRAGRAGRTTPGVCYRLYSELDYANMNQHKVPEMQRCNLDSVVLKLKCFKVDVLGFDFIQRPLDQALQNSLQYLKDIQALDEEEQITPLGQLMAQIQTEPRMSRILIEAFYRDVFTEVLSIISVMLNNSTLYIRTANIDTKIELLDETGDFMTFYKIYWQFKSLTTSQSCTNYSIKQYCLEKGYHYKTLRVCETTFDEIYKTFICFSEQLQLNQEVKKQILFSNSSTKEDCIMRCFLVAFYPDICVYNGNPLIGYSIVKSNKNIRVYGTCALSLLNHYPKYIICTDLYSSKFDFCKVAQEVTIEQLEQVLNEKQLDSVKNYIPKSYHYQELKNIPQSFMNHLMHKFSSIYDNNQFHQYCNINKDQCTFQIWSKEEIDLEKEKKEYYETLKKYQLCKFYGQKMLVYFKHGVEVHTTTVCSISELTIIQFIDCPYNVDTLRGILEQNQFVFTNIFEINANQFGYCGQIFTDTFTNAKTICDNLNYECQRYFQEYQINQEHRMLFTIKPRSIQNRIVKPSAELRFYGFPNKGTGYVKFNSNEDADLFLLSTRNSDDLLMFQGIPQQVKKGQDAELRISGLPINTDEKLIEMYLKRVANQLEIATPLYVRLNPDNDPKYIKDWIAEVTQLFEKHLNEKPFIDLKPDKQNYRIIARASGFSNVIKLEEMRKNINIQYDIIGYSSVNMKTEYKIIRFSKQQDETEQLIEQVKAELQKKYSEDLLQIIQREKNLVIVGKNPNLVRWASYMLHGVTTGFAINIKLTKRIFKQLLENEEFVDELFDLQSNLNLNFKYNRYLLFKGKIQIFTLNENLGKIEEAINALINNQVSKSLCVDVKNYTFKPLLNANNNILAQLQNKFQVTIDFSIQSKKVFIYGNHDQTVQCKEQLLQLLISEQNQLIQESCGICLDPLKDKFILSLCGHYFCRPCLFDTFQQVESILKKCPQCSESISLQDLQCLFCEIDFDKFLNQSFKNYKTKNADKYVQCYTPDCEEYFQTVPEDQEPFYYCESCLSSFCSKCKNFAHPKLTCEEAKAEFTGNKQLSEEELQKLKIKICPRCSIGVQKNEGCNHMTCLQCNNHFCWICMHQANNKEDIYDHIRNRHPGRLFEQDAY